MAESTNMILPMLREIRAENAARHAEVLARLDAVERAQASFKNALSADTLMSRLLTGEFDQRIESLENRVRELESRS